MRKAAPWLLFVAALVGMYLAWHLTEIHYEIKAAPAGDFKATCDVNETISCTGVNASPYGRFKLGESELPVSIPGLGFHGAVALLALMAAFGSEDRRRNAFVLALVGSVPAVAFGLWLVFVQAFILKKWCLYCLGLDGATLGVLVFSYIGWGGKPGEVWPAFQKTDKSYWAVALGAMLVVTFLGWTAYASWIEDAGRPSLVDKGKTGSTPAPSRGAEDEEQVQEAKKAVKDFLAKYPSVAAQPLKVNPFDAMKGNGEARITVVEFADFECPHCKLAGFFLKDIAHRYGDKARFVFKNYPLSSRCNELISRDLHPDSCEAAVAVQCARRQGKFWDFHDHTFDNQGSLGTAKMLQIAQTLELDMGRFQSCLANDAVAEEVQSQLMDGQSVGIQGTPSIYVNGKPLDSPHPLFVEAALRYELQQAGEPLPADAEGLFPF
jgi:protein-disulfide isomerase/uncharacterized membrane protein